MSPQCPQVTTRAFFATQEPAQSPAGTPGHENLSSDCSAGLDGAAGAKGLNLPAAGRFLHFSRILKSKSHQWVSLTFTWLIPPPPSPSEKYTDTHSPAQQFTGWGLQAQETHGKEESSHFFLMPPMQNPWQRKPELISAAEWGRSLDFLCLPQCPAHLTQINLSQPSWWHHKDAAQEPRGKVCQQEMPELGASCDPSIPAFLSVLKFLLGSLHQASCGGT